MLCPHTPGGQTSAELRKANEDTADGRSWRVKIVETAGVNVPSKYAGYPWAVGVSAEISKIQLSVGQESNSQDD